MIIVSEVVKEYCKEKQLPPPSKNDLDNLGRAISYHFKNYFCSDIGVNTILDGTGLYKTEEDGKPVVVSFYPDRFKSEMISRIELFYACKEKRIADSAEVEKPKRKRIKVTATGPKKVGSSNPVTVRNLTANTPKSNFTIDTTKGNGKES